MDREMVNMTNQTEEMKKILEKLYKIESRNTLFESCNQSHEKTSKGITKILDSIYKEADHIASYLSEKIKHDKDELKYLIREMVVAYEKVMENVIPIDRSNIKNLEVQKRIKNAIINFMTLRDWNPKFDPEQQAEWAAEDYGLDKEFFKKLLRDKGLLNK